MTTDQDLLFLASRPNDELQVLCDLLTHDRNGELRLTEQLTGTDAYNRCYPSDMMFLVPDIAYELRKFGTNTLKTLFKGEPDSYATIVRRVCKQMHIDVVDDADVQSMEYALLTTFCEEVIGKLSERELRLLANEYGIPTKNLSRQAMAAALMMALKSSKHIFARFVSYIMTSVMEMLVVRGVATAGIESVGRAIGGLAGPIGWAALTVWTIYDIASPAYRVCVPAILQIASMRLEHKPLPIVTIRVA